jgi:hypothetical protein
MTPDDDKRLHELQCQLANLSFSFLYVDILRVIEREDIGAGEKTEIIMAAIKELLKEANEETEGT